MTKGPFWMFAAYLESRRRKRLAWTQRWLCPHCGKIDPGKESICWNCGGSLAKPEWILEKSWWQWGGMNRLQYFLTLVALGTIFGIAYAWGSTGTMETAAVVCTFITYVATGNRWDNAGGRLLNPAELGYLFPLFVFYIPHCFFVGTKRLDQEWVRTLRRAARENNF